MAQFLAPVINSQQEDANGAPLTGGAVEVYLAGSSTPATTYSDKAGLVPNTWPITLNTLGVNEQGAVWLTGGFAYKYVIKDGDGVTQRTIDNISGINDNTGTLDQWAPYQATPTYVSATSFTVGGDQTQTFQVGRRIRTQNTGGVVHSTITGSVFSTPNTTVTVRNDSSVLDSGLSQVWYSVLSVVDTSLPGGMINYGQCRLTKSGANLLLSPLNGNRITINGSVCVIPAAGVTLAPGAVVAGTMYYIYAFMSGATLTLEASTTAHAADAVTGVQIKSGDPTRTLVGMARPIAGPAWSDTGIQRFVLSWFNRRDLAMSNGFASNQSYSGTSPVEILGTTKNEFLIWADEPIIKMAVTGGMYNSGASNYTYTTVGIDGATPEDSFCIFQGTAAVQAAPISVYATNDSKIEGYHYTNILGYSTAGTGTWVGGAAGVRTSHSTIIRG